MIEVTEFYLLFFACIKDNRFLTQIEPETRNNKSDADNDAWSNVKYLTTESTIAKDDKKIIILLAPSLILSKVLDFDSKIILIYLITARK